MSPGQWLRRDDANLAEPRLPRPVGTDAAEAAKGANTCVCRDWSI